MSDFKPYKNTTKRPVWIQEDDNKWRLTFLGYVSCFVIILLWNIFLENIVSINALINYSIIRFILFVILFKTFMALIELKKDHGPEPILV